MDELSEMISSTVDKRALKVLSATYWSASGWKKEYDVSAADLTYAKNAGLMFDPMHLTHGQAVEWAIRSRDSVSREQVVSHFLASLTSRRLDLRSALGSFAAARNLADHTWSRTSGPAHYCPVCGVYESNKPNDISVLNFERFKWGGVRHSDPIYIGLDLEEVGKQPTAVPTTEDRQIMLTILQAARSMPADAKLSDLERKLASLFRSNTQERRVLIGILGYCGILVDPARSNFLDTFPDFCSRQDAPSAKNDWPYPVRWWRGVFGVAEPGVNFWFPAL